MINLISEKRLKALLAELKKGLKSIYGSRLRGFFLYGSYARGEQQKDSDIDVLIVLDQIEHYAGEVDRSGQAASDLSLKYGVSISRVFVSELDWQQKKDSFFLDNVREEAVAA